MRRVRVVGNSGSGKTTFAGALAKRLGVTHIELDAIFWDRDWTFADDDVAQARLRDLLDGEASDGWVACGNWNNRLGPDGGLLADADAIVWLDYSRRVIMPRIVRRTVSRALTRREIWHGNRERPANLLKRSPEDNIIRWSWTQHFAYRERYARLAAEDPRVIRLRTPREARRFLAQADPS